MNDPMLKSLDKRMKKTLVTLKGELLDNLQVNAYGSPMPLNQVASLNVPEPRMITVQPWDKGTLKAIEKAIRESDLGLNPVNDGHLLRVPLPELTEERRKELVKLVHKYGEQCKIAMRNVRRDVLDQLKKQEKNKEISKDDMRQEEKKIQEHTDRHIKDVDEVVTQKEADIMHV